MHDPNAPHLDDEALSAAVDAALGAAAPDDASAAHLGACLACARRRDALVAARRLLASAPVDAPDELTRRRLIVRALAETAPDAAPQAGPRYLRWAMAAGGVAAALVALLAAVPLLGEPETTAEETAARALADTPFLGDLGELSDPAALRSSFGQTYALEATPDAARRSDDAYGEAPGAAESAPAAPAPYAPASDGVPLPARPPGEPSPSAGTLERQVGRDDLTADAPAVLDRAVTEQCAAALADGPGRGARLVATAVGTYRGTPAVMAAFTRGSLTTAFIAARDDCRVLDSYRL